MMDGITICMPAYNAEKTIEQVFRRIPDNIRRMITRYLVVDDGSTDQTWSIMQRLAAALPAFTPLRHEQNRGYGAAEKTLLQAALEHGAEFMIILHADGQYAPESLLEIFTVFEQGDADIVQGSRMKGGGALKGGMPLYKALANRSLTFIENRVFRLGLAEYHSGYMCYRRRFVEAIRFQELSDSFDFDLEMLAMARVGRFTVKEVAIPTRYADEVSHLNPIHYGFDVLRVIRRYLAGYYQDKLRAPKAP